MTLPSRPLLAPRMMMTSSSLRMGIERTWRGGGLVMGDLEALVRDRNTVGDLREVVGFCLRCASLVVPC